MPDDGVEQKIIENEKLVHFVIGRYFPGYRKDEDIVQCGQIGLWKACENFDGERSRFSTFAARCIFNEIAKELRARSKEQKKGNVVSLDEVIGTEEDPDCDITLGSTIPSIEEGYCAVDYDISSVERKLSKRNAEVFRMHVNGLGAADISRFFGFSRQRAAGIIKDAQYIARRELPIR